MPAIYKILYNFATSGSGFYVFDSGFAKNSNSNKWCIYDFGVTQPCINKIEFMNAINEDLDTLDFIEAQIKYLAFKYYIENNNDEFAEEE